MESAELKESENRKEEIIREIHPLLQEGRRESSKQKLKLFKNKKVNNSGWVDST